MLFDNAYGLFVLPLGVIGMLDYMLSVIVCLLLLLMSFVC